MFKLESVATLRSVMNKPILTQLVKEIESLAQDLPVNFELPAEQSAILAVPAFKFAKKKGISLAEATTEIQNLISGIKGIETSVSGGFVNISLDEGLYIQVLDQSRQSEYGQTDLGEGKTVVIDYSSPNIAKPMSIGHLRSTVIGDALKRIYMNQGYQVVGINFLGDWGTQFGKLLYAYNKKYGDFKPHPVSLDELLSLYIAFHTESADNQDLEDQARQLFARLDQGDQELRLLWQHLVKVSKQELERLYDLLGIEHFEVFDGESNYIEEAEAIIDLAQEKSLAIENEGALIVELPDLGTPLLLKKKDGTTLYASRDLAALSDRVKKYDPDKIIYVVANEQALHFQQVFSVAKKLDLAPGVELVHAKFGLITLPEGKISTRLGRVIFLEDVVKQAVERAEKVVKEKNPKLNGGEVKVIATKIGVGALKFFDLASNRLHDIVFDWDNMLALNGRAAPYLQYSYTRAKGILNKVQPSKLSMSELDDLNFNEYKKQIKVLARLPLVIDSSVKKDSPHILAQYLLEVASQFHSFYENYPVTTAKTDQQERLMIVEAFANVLKNGLILLGIEVSETM